MLALALAAIAGWLALPTVARAAPPDRVSVTSAPAARDTVRRAAPLPTPWTQQPRVVMLRSLLVPGWGQWHNHARWKAAAVAGTEVMFGALLIEDHRQVGRLLAATERERTGGSPEGYESAINRYNAKLDTYVGRQWLFAGVLAYALVDAYVDAHFRDFEIEFRTDPALPDGVPTDLGRPTSGRRGGTPAARIALRWRF